MSEFVSVSDCLRRDADLEKKCNATSKRSVSLRFVRMREVGMENDVRGFVLGRVYR